MNTYSFLLEGSTSIARLQRRLRTASGPEAEDILKKLKYQEHRSSRRTSMHKARIKGEQDDILEKGEKEGGTAGAILGGTIGAPIGAVGGFMLDKNLPSGMNIPLYSATAGTVFGSVAGSKIGRFIGTPLGTLGARFSDEYANTINRLNAIRNGRKLDKAARAARLARV